MVMANCPLMDISYTSRVLSSIFGDGEKRAKLVAERLRKKRHRAEETTEKSVVRGSRAICHSTQGAMGCRLFKKGGKFEPKFLGHT